MTFMNEKTGAIKSKFVCDTSNPVFKNWVEQDHPQAIESKKQKVEFISKSMEALDKDWNDHWNNLWDLLVSDGLIDRDLKREEHRMSLTEDQKQFFIQKKEEQLPDFIKNLLKG